MSVLGASRRECVCIHTHIPLPQPDPLDTVWRAGGPQPHTKRTSQPPAQLCSPLSRGGGAEMGRGADGPGVRKQSCFAAFLLSGTSGLAGCTEPPPLTGHPQSHNQNGNRQGSRGLSPPRTLTRMGLVWWFLSLHTKDKKTRPSRMVADFGHIWWCGEGFKCRCLVSVLGGKWSGSQKISFLLLTGISRAGFKGGGENGLPACLQLRIT